MCSDSPGGPFDAESIDRVAANHAIDGERLRSLVDAHQEQMGALPGVENLVYEWRKQFDATVLHRTDAAYYVAAPEWAWGEFGDSLGATDEEMAAIRDLHRRVTAEFGDVGPETTDVAAPMVLLRE